MNYIFSVAAMANMLSMTAMLILLSMAGKSHLAADLGIIQASTSALFYTFSANARNIILATSNSGLAKSIFNIRAILLAPLIVAAFWMNSAVSDIEPLFAAAMVLRRAVEWLGEIDLSERERAGDGNFAITYILTQGVLFIFAALWLLMNMPHPLLGLFCWALLPTILSVSFFWAALKDIANAMAGISRKIAPHFGSTAVIGLSLYVFRLLLILILGKNVSGDLFAAFAIGGVLGAIATSAFAPSIVFKEKMAGGRAVALPRLLTFTLWTYSCFGIWLVGASFLSPGIFLWLGKNILYWKAIGFAMIGGVVMTHAQLLRNRLLIHNENHDLFGPDLLINMLVIAIVPFAYFLFGIEAMAGLSLIGALLAWVFYKSSEIEEILALNKHPDLIKYLQISIAVFVLTPVFLQLDSGIFLSRETLETGGDSLASVPIPPSLFLSYLAILAIGAYRSAHLSLSTVFFSFILMVFSTLLVSTSRFDLEQSKVILIIQFIAPMGALILGEMFKSEGFDTEAQMERAFLFVLAALIPLQLVSSWMQGSLQLVGYVYLFSIYQHAHYVPVVFVVAYLMAVFSLWSDGKYRKVLLIISPLVGIYAAASMSPSAIVFLLAGIFIFTIFKWPSNSGRQAASLFFTVLAICLGYLGIEIFYMEAANNFIGIDFETRRAWGHYAGEIGSGVRALLLGHAVVIDKSMYSSAHNYWLDMIRNFGLFALIPLLVLFGYTVRMAYWAKSYFIKDMALLGHLLVLIMLIVIDNSTEVGLRQPYSGVFTYFLWGLFIARLNRLNIHGKHDGNITEQRADAWMSV